MSSHQQDQESIDDLSALAWVHDELRRTLEAAHKTLRRFVKEQEALPSSDVDAPDVGVLRSARAQLHQGAGALELVGLPTAALVLRASEAALIKLTATRPIKLDAKAVGVIEQLSFALLDYLGRMLAGKMVSPLAMFPQYRAAQDLAGADRVHPADLWPMDWQWHDVASDGTPVREMDGSVRTEVEGLALDLMRRGETATAKALSDLFAALSGAFDKPLSTVWRMAAGFFEAQSQGLLHLDVYSKRVPSRLLAQLRMTEKAGAGAGAAPADVSQRLAHDLLFFCAQAASPGDGSRAPRLAAVRHAWTLARRPPVDYESPQLGRHDPAVVAQAKKRVAAAKETWSGLAASEMHRMGALVEQVQLVGDSLTKLFPNGARLAMALNAAASQTLASNAAPPTSVAMEVATSVLYLEASLEEGEFDGHQAKRITRLAERLSSVVQGGQPQPLDDWMEALYRRVSDRQTMGTVVQELRAAMGEAEKGLDRYFRDATQRDALLPVPGQLNAMRGVFSVLGLDAASHAVVRMRNDVDALIADASGVPDATNVNRLAHNMGALGFLVDMLNVQPAMGKALYAFDAESGELRSESVAPRYISGFGSLSSTGVHRAPDASIEPRLVEQAQSLALAAAQPDVPVGEVRRELERLSHEAMVSDQPELAQTMTEVRSALDVARTSQEQQAVRDELAHAMSDFVRTSAHAVFDEAPVEPRHIPTLPVTPTPAGQTGLEEDEEMLGIFLEEAREVIDNAQQALRALADQPSDIENTTNVRRAFHTLKGSSRMLGLNEFGEAAWSGEQLYNAQLAEQQAVDAPLLTLTGDVMAYMADWANAIERRRKSDHNPADVQRSIESLRQGQAPRLALPGAFSLSIGGVNLTPPPPAPIAQVVQTASPAAAEPVLETISLTERVPDLPSAADLELLPASAAVPAGVAAPEGAEPPLSFTLDLSDEPATMPVLKQEPAPALDSVSSLMGLRLETEPDVVPATEAPPVTEPAFDITMPGLIPPAPAEMPAVEEAPVQAAPAPAPIEDTSYETHKIIGDLRVPIPLFNIYLSEADEQSRRLATELAEWSMETTQPVSDNAVALAHSLAGNSATVGYSELSHLARGLEHALMRSQATGEGDPVEAELFNEVAEEIRRLLHQFAAGILKTVPQALLARLSDHERYTDERRAAIAQRRAAEAAEEAAAPLRPAPVVPVAPVVVVPEPEAAPVPVEPVPAPVVAVPQAVVLQPLAELAPLVHVDSAKAVMHSGGHLALDEDDDIDAVDAVDAELFPIFEEEALELLPQLATRMRAWVSKPSDNGAASAVMRSLHTIKGGARLAGAMRLGEMAHRLETSVEHLAGSGDTNAAQVDALMGRVDRINALFEALQAGGGRVAEPVVAPAPVTPVVPTAPVEPAAPKVALMPSPAASSSASLTVMDWQRFMAGRAVLPAAAAAATSRADRSSPSSATVRVRAPLLDRMANHAGEVSIARARLESQVTQLKSSLTDLTENLERLRAQLRDIELQAESQISSRIEAAKAVGQNFDPLEMDRFTRFQELTRMMAESVNDVATVQRTFQRSLQGAEDELAVQHRLTRDLQDDMLRTRMVEFESLSDRLYRVVRQAAKELHKQVRLDIEGGSIEVDRGVLERMAGAFEHLIRNCVTHGIELPAQRQAANKDGTGQITISVAQEGNEVAVAFRDDGAGLDLVRIRERAVAAGLLDAQAPVSDAELAELIFQPGFTTAESVTELAGRGVGMDVVRSEVNALGGRIETSTSKGLGTNFRLVLPLTTAVTQVVMLRAGQVTVAVPATLIQTVRRLPAAQVLGACNSGELVLDGQPLPMYWLGALLQGSGASVEAPTKNLPVVIISSAQQRVALHVDEVVGNQEVVVKNLGDQLARLPGLAGVTLLASGSPALIYNPVALAAVYGNTARGLMRDAMAAPTQTAGTAAAPKAAQEPLVLVVDDSLTVRRVTQRLLAREGYRVVLAKDGLDALEKLAEELPAIVLSDIEMPRMDGFDLVRNMRADSRLTKLPVVMITSRIAQKHRDHAAELGVNHYLGKPYSEEELLGLVQRYARAGALT
jgi:chemosensory pili system protein ChpA (sensor histidine kinase/response regulator)